MIFVGRCRDGGGAADQKIAAFDRSYRVGLASVGRLVDRGDSNREQARSHRGLRCQQGYSAGGLSFASSSATFASRLSRRARVRASTTIWLSNSSRLTRSSLLKPLCNNALNWLSISLFGSGVSPLKRREAVPVRASRKSLGASMGNVLKTMAGSVSRSVYSQSRPQGCTLFAHADGRHRTVVVRYASCNRAQQATVAGKRLISGVFGEMASFLLSR